ncbi:uncharacterized protein EV154DRAFT_498975 [Mucor mucedo]|uniref:uncharacterized protein n=1 Tax=Mucor mucedo TaxID=29922 RepID=UPI00221F1742|nr:uncharacterized protein EV154DRAFT_498975 [Mucor mucedo]KAI7894233.1 hypothetical protein EV154DRAFT_498975 [Mucor mucedo]
MEDLAQSVPNMRLTDQKQITKNTESKGSVERVTSVTQKSNSLLPSPSNYSVEVKEIEEKLKKLTILSSSKKKHLLTEERQHVKTALDTLPAQSNTEFNVFVECSLALEPLSLSDSESSETPLSDSYDKSSGFEDQSHVRLETTEEKNETGCIQELPNIIITDPYTSQTTDIAKDKNTIQATFIYEDQSYGQQKETYASASSNTYTIEDCHTNITEITGDDIQMDNYAKSIGSDLIQETRKNREYYCDICKTTTPTEDIYKKHLVNEHEIIPEPFIVSGKAQMDNSIVNRSRVEKSRENGAGDRSSVGDIYCALCQRHYMDKNYLRIHAQAVHPKEFIEWTQMNFQKPTYRGNSNTIYKCVKCDSKLEGITSLQRHYLDVHETPLKVVYPTDKLYVEDTEKEMNLLSALYDIYGPIFGSETTHQPVLDDLQIHCRVCSKKFENPGDYVDHNLTPHDDAPASPIKHTLDVLRFTDSLKTDIDLDNVVYDDKDPDFYCSLCDIKCDKSAAFADHKRSNIHLHNSSYKISEPPNFNPLFYYCNICNRGYDTENSILNHVKYNHANAQMLSKNQTHINPVFILPKVESKTIENELDHRSVVIRNTIKAIMNKPMKECNAISEITCGVCDTLQTTTSRLRSHMEKKHNFEQCTEMLFYCYICLIDCRKESIFSVHIATRKHMKAALRPENRLINVHQVSIDYTDNERDYCEVCRTAFQNPRLYMNHKATINHQINYLISTSQHAPSSEPTQDALVLWNRYMNIVRTHRTRLATPGQLEFNCNICRISFTSSMHSLLHLATRLHKTNCMTEIIETSNSDEETDTDTCNTEEETGQEACDLEEVTNKEVCNTEEVTNKACYTEEENGQEARNLQELMDKEAQTQDINSKQSQSKDITYSKSNVREVLPNFYCKACDKPFKFLSQFQSHSITRGHRQALRNNTLPDNTKVSNDTEVFNDTENFDDDGSDYCNEFDSNSVLSQYEEILPENSFDNSYDCKLCNVSYSEPYLLADHLSTPNHKRFLESTIYRDEVRKAERDIADNTHCGPSIFSPGGFKDLAIGRQEYQTSTHTSAEKLNNVFQLTFNMEKEKAMPISSVANYHCELCDVSFYSANVLTNHLLTKDHKEKMNSTTSVEESTVFPLTRMAEPQNIPENFSTVEPLAKCKVIRENKNTEPKIKNTTIPFDLDLHCDSCDKTFTTKHSSLMHFFKMHKSYYPDLSPKNQPQRKLNAVALHKHNIMPDQNNPKLFCRACRKIFNNKGNFRLHLMSKHKMNLNEDNLPGNNLNIVLNAHTIKIIGNPKLYKLSKFGTLTH